MALEYAVVDAVKSAIELEQDQQLDWTDEQTDVLQKICDDVNDYIEQEIEVAAGPSDTTVFYLDGLSARELGRLLIFRLGIRELTSLEIAPYTGSTNWYAVPSADVLLRPLEQDRTSPGIPPQQIWLSDYPTGNYGHFPTGMANVRLTCDAGPAEILPRLTEIAEHTAARAWFARRAGQEDMTGTDANGRPLVSRWVAGRDMNTLAKIRNAFRKFAV